MKNKVLLIVLTFFSVLVFANNSCVCSDSIDLKKNTRIINKEERNLAPYNSIIQISYKRWASGIATATFIADDLLITARHNVGKKLGKKTQYIDLHYSTNINKSIRLNKNEFEIAEKGSGLNGDIALIKIKDPSKLKDIIHGKMDVMDFFSVNESPDKVVNLSGYPCDTEDTLVEKSTILKNIGLEIGGEIQYKFCSYPLFTCTRDSGSPLWLKVNDRWVIVGIHHGGASDAGFYEKLSMSVLINKDVINWIEQYK